MSLRLVIVDDDPAIRKLLSNILTKCGDFQIVEFGEGKPALEHLGKVGADIVLLDLLLPDTSGFEVMEGMNRLLADEALTIVITGHGDMEKAIRSMRLGAFDFITKPIHAEVVEQALKRAFRTARLKRAMELQKNLKHSAMGRIIGESEAIKEVKRRIVTSARDRFASVLITGESGTGKELAARAVHELSPRGEGPFVPVNCAAIPEALLESELFGHAKGAFTGADKAKSGLFALADGGSMFLDEIGEMPMSLQAKLLRYLDDGMVLPLGSTRWIRTDVRVIAATNKELEKAVEEGTFRTDLYYRLSVIEIHMPPLRERKEDVALLMEHHLSDQAARRGLAKPRLSDEAMELLVAYKWPGNVRELVNLCVKLVVEHPGEVVRPEHLAFSGTGRERLEVDVNLPYDMAKRRVMERFTVNYFSALLARHGGNVSAAAREAGIERSYLHRIIKKYGLKEATGR